MDKKKSYIPPEAHAAVPPDGMPSNLEALSNERWEELLNSQTMKEAKKRYQIKEGYCIRDFCGESLVIPVGGEAFTERQVAMLNPVGTFLWNKLQTEQTFGDLLLAAMQEYEVSREEASADIQEFLTELEALKYLKEKKENEP